MNCPLYCCGFIKDSRGGTWLKGLGHGVLLLIRSQYGNACGYTEGDCHMLHVSGRSESFNETRNFILSIVSHESQ